MPKHKKKARKGPTMAELADPHVLYEQSVQAVDFEVEFLATTFRKLRGRKAKLLREDFCGTANAACEWVRVAKSHRAIGVDFDASVLEWGRNHHVARLKRGAQERIELREANVLDVRTEPADILVAFNFSYWTFRDRASLRAYFEKVREALVSDGLFFLDAYGGYEAFEEQEEETEYEDFTYVWDQALYDPVTGDAVCHIHFRFPDGSKLKQAFSYHWRLWSLPEIREVLAEAGFSRSTVYWQGTDEDGEPSGDFYPVEHGEADPAWIAYIVAEP
jgi:hypothetical protein